MGTLNQKDSCRPTSPEGPQASCRLTLNPHRTHFLAEGLHPLSEARTRVGRYPHPLRSLTAHGQAPWPAADPRSDSRPDLLLRGGQIQRCRRPGRAGGPGSARSAPLGSLRPWPQGAGDGGGEGRGECSGPAPRRRLGRGLEAGPRDRGRFSRSQARALRAAGGGVRVLQDLPAWPRLPSHNPCCPVINNNDIDYGRVPLTHFPIYFSEQS